MNKLIAEFLQFNSASRRLKNPGSNHYKFLKLSYLIFFFELIRQFHAKGLSFQKPDHASQKLESLFPVRQQAPI